MRMRAITTTKNHLQQEQLLKGVNFVCKLFLKKKSLDGLLQKEGGVYSCLPSAGEAVVSSNTGKWQL